MGPVTTPGEQWAEIAREHGTATTVAWCIDLLTGAASVGHLDHPAFAALDRETQHVRAILDGSPDYWLRVWGARGLLYVWDDSASAAVVGGLTDEHWRVREMCAKVCRRRGLGQAADSIAGLLADGTPRVRLAAVRALTELGEAEHARAIREVVDDADPKVAAAADAALTAMSKRLDRDLRSEERY